MNITPAFVERLVLRQAESVSTPEARLICWLLGHWIHQELTDRSAELLKGVDRAGLPPFGSPWWSGGFLWYCEAVDINPQALIRMAREMLYVMADGTIELTAGGHSITVHLSSAAKGGGVESDALARQVRAQIDSGARALVNNWGRHADASSSTSQKGGVHVAPKFC